MRVLVHVGLAALLVLAPALCCCHVRLLAARVFAALPAPPCCPDHPSPKPARKSCCHEPEPTKAEQSPPASPKPPAPQPGDCLCLCERPEATPPEPAPTVADPQPTGELLPPGLAGPGTSPEHLGRPGGPEPPGWAGVDTRSAVLFSRHVLRC